MSMPVTAYLCLDRTSNGSCFAFNHFEDGHSVATHPADPFARSWKAAAWLLASAFAPSACPPPPRRASASGDGRRDTPWRSTTPRHGVRECLQRAVTLLANLRVPSMPRPVPAFALATRTCWAGGETTVATQRCIHSQPSTETTHEHCVPIV